MKSVWPRSARMAGHKTPTEQNKSRAALTRSPLSRQPLSRFLKGLLVGVIIVLPGMSGGTLILMLGLYEALMQDLSHIRILPWLTFAAGLAIGMIASGWLFTFALATYTTYILAFLLGCVVASVHSIARDSRHFRTSHLIALLIGGLTGFLLSETASFSIGAQGQPHLLLTLSVSALASAAMILPGVPGSSVFIIAGIYDDIMAALARFDWQILLPVAIGGIAGVFALSNLFSHLYRRWQGPLSWLFAGLILGSARMLVPAKIGHPLLFVLCVIAGLALTIIWETRSSGQKAA